MSVDKKSCVICAWRETCQKRFSVTYDIALNCPDYTFDVTLKQQRDIREGDKYSEEKDEKKK